MDYFGKNQLSIRPRRQTITRNVINKPKSAKFEREKRKAEKARLKALLCPRTLQDMFKELKAAKEDVTMTHPELCESEVIFVKRTTEQLERVDVAQIFTMKRIQGEFSCRESKISDATERKLAELYAEMEKDAELFEKRTECEYTSLEINKPTTSIPIDVNKKTLRGRGGVLIEPPTYFNATPKTAVISVNSNARFLLQETVISDDLEHIFSTMPHEPHKNQRHYDVHLQKLKFVYEGKTYKQGEEVYVENNEYGKIPAKAENVTELVVSFKASQSWDIRQIHASHSDLAEGRVKVYKRKNN